MPHSDFWEIPLLAPNPLPFYSKANFPNKNKRRVRGKNQHQHQPGQECSNFPLRTQTLRGRSPIFNIISSNASFKKRFLFFFQGTQNSSQGRSSSASDKILFCVTFCFVIFASAGINININIDIHKLSSLHLLVAINIFTTRQYLKLIFLIHIYHNIDTYILIGNYSAIESHHQL